MRACRVMEAVEDDPRVSGDLVRDWGDDHRDGSPDTCAGKTGLAGANDEHRHCAIIALLR